MEMAQRIRRYLQEAPKAELHVHLEGAIRPETLIALARRNKVTLPVTTVEEAREWFKFRNFTHFVEIFFAISSCLKTADDYELIAYEFGAEMARQHVRYAEVTFSASTHEYSFTTSTRFTILFTFRLIQSTIFCSMASGIVLCPPNRSKKWKRSSGPS